MACPEDDLGGNDWNLTPNKDTLHQAFLGYCATHRLRTIDKPLFGKELRKMLPNCNVGTIKLNGGGVRSTCHKLPALQECREAFQQYLNAGPEIWEEETPAA